MMRLYTPIIILVLLALAITSADAQGTFGNLDFESANIPSGTPPNAAISSLNAFPKWSANSMVGYDFFSTGGTVISIVDSAVSGFAPIQGDYSVFLFGGAGDVATLSQTAIIPMGSHSLTVDLTGSGVSLLNISIGDQTIQIVPLATFANYTEYGGDISTFAGQEQQLSFTEQPPMGVPPSVLELDDVAFSPNLVPEPTIWNLILCGTAFFGLTRSEQPDCNS
ncbi:MAG TPA: hypothetical protein VH413_13675 [Verrucomicrobiae bacterium]|jgi:hypothetical protein|nr:hypothetical protein [Verrucomicrobiae bacterium]